MEDNAGNVYWAKTYSYDILGNILKEKEYGNLTGAQSGTLVLNKDGTLDESQEGHVKSYVYTQKDNFDVVNQIDMKGSGICFWYKKGSNLLQKKFILEKKSIRKRWFYFYNEDAALTQTLIDDGNTSDFEVIKKLNIRLITNISPKMELPGVGAPEVIEEKYYDIKNEQEILIKRTINQFDSEGNIFQQEIYDANGEYNYTLKKNYEKGLLVMENNLLGEEWHYSYDDNHNLIHEKNTSTGVSTEYCYDLENRLASTIKSGDGYSFETSISFNASGYKTSEIDQYGNETCYSIDDLGRIKSVTYPDIISENGELFSPSYAYEYDLFDHVTQTIDPYGSVTTKTNTIRGNPIHIQYPDGGQEFFKYDLEGSLHRHCGIDGIIRVFEYDYMGRLNHIEYYPRGSKGLRDGYKRKYYEYDAMHLTSIKDEKKDITNYSYDGAGRLASIRNGFQKVEFFYDPLGRINTFKKWKSKKSFTCEKKEYDLVGNVTVESLEDETGKLLSKKEFSYDDSGRLEKIIGYPQNQHSVLKRFEYDPFGRLNKEIDAEGSVTEIQYENGFINEWGQKVLKKRTIDPQGNSLEEVFNVTGNLASICKKNASGKVLSSSQFFFDAFGNEISQRNTIINPKGSPKNYQSSKTYLFGSYLEKMHTALGTLEEAVTKFTYNHFGDLLTKQEPKVSSPISYKYDQFGDLSCIHFQEKGKKRANCKLIYDIVGNLTEVNMANKAHLSYKFDANNQLKQEKIRDLFGEYSIEYSYDGEGCITQIKVPDGSLIQYEYEGPFIKKVLRLSKEKQVLYQHRIFSRDLMGNILEEILPYHAGSRTQSFDTLGRKKKIATDFFQDSIPNEGYDFLGNVKMREIDIDGESSQIFYEYDALNQLLSEKEEIERSYTYDSIGNRYSKNESPYELNDANQIIQAEGATYIFDPRGNLSTKNVGDRIWNFKYNFLNQLISITLPDKAIISFTYDLSGKRLSKKVEKNGDSQVFRYFYLKDTELGYIDSKGNIIELRVPSNPNQPEREPFIAFEIGRETYVPIYDLQGNVACLVDPEERRTEESYRYSAFGEEKIFNRRGREIGQSSLGNPWRYRGNRIDEDTGYMYVGHRYYDSKIGRWISPDPMGDLDGPNLYIYCQNNPLIYMDYFGLAKEKNNSSVDESYFYGEYEPPCHCERHRDCKRGGDIATNPTLHAGVNIESVVDLSLEVFAHPRVQGSMQAFAGLAEASAGGLATLSSGGLAAPVGWPVLMHGLDQFIAGMSAAITGTYRATLTEQLLEASGMSLDWASFTNDALTIGGTMGGLAIVRASRLRAFPSYKIPNNQQHIEDGVITLKNNRQKVDNAIKATENFLGGKGKIITNADGDIILMKGNRKVRFDVKHPHADKPHFHLEQKMPNGKWVDASSEHRFYFTGD